MLLGEGLDDLQGLQVIQCTVQNGGEDRPCRYGMRHHVLVVIPTQEIDRRIDLLFRLQALLVYAKPLEHLMDQIGHIRDRGLEQAFGEGALGVGIQAEICADAACIQGHILPMGDYKKQARRVAE